jgi:cell division protein FtsI/penicillin-binding protein 2
LTINDRIQEAAYQTLVSYRACGSKKSDNRRSRPACGGLSRGQTATLVVLDADEQTPGAIRAIASLPEPPKKLHLWDLSALEDSDVTPTGLGWRAVGRDNVPGSTFKAITSMTAITAATAPDTNPDYTAFAATLRRLLSGGMSAQAQVDLLRLAYAPPAPARQRGSRRVAACTPERRRPEDSNTIPVPDTGRPSWCGRNFHGAQFWDPKAPGDTKCPAALGGGSQFGMCEALMVSSNLFFGGVAQHLINSPLLDNRGDPITLAVARRLTFGSGIRAPLPGYAKSTANGFDLTRGQAPAPRLSADPVDMTAALPENRRRNPGAVVRSGFGDDVQATPLAMATAYASIARQKFVRPTIVPTERDSQGCPKVRADPDECKDILEGARDAGPLMRVLRAGLHAVATSGSGRAAFNTPDGKMFLELNHQPRLFVKTGTATVVKGRRFSLWMAGWIEGAPGTNIPTRLAFACFLTHRTNAEVGGGTCGPIIRDLLVRLDRTGSG